MIVKDCVIFERALLHPARNHTTLHDHVLLGTFSTVNSAMRYRNSSNSKAEKWVCHLRFFTFSAFLTASRYVKAVLYVFFCCYFSCLYKERFHWGWNSRLLIKLKPFWFCIELHIIVLNSEICHIGVSHLVQRHNLFTYLNTQKFFLCSKICKKNNVSGPDERPHYEEVRSLLSTKIKREVPGAC